MNTRVRTRLQSGRTPLKHEKFKFPLVLKETIKIQGSKPNDATKTAAENQQASNRQRKIALQQDVDKLKKKLRHEENIHRALERSFNRPLGALPRLPSYLPPATLELLAEVAVLEEEVVRLEEQVVHFRQDLYQEAVYISSSKRNLESFADIYHLHPNKNARAEQHKSLPTKLDEAARSKRHLPPLSEDGPGKQNQLCTSLKSNKGLSVNKTQTGRNPLKRPIDTTTSEKCSDPQKLQLESRITSQVQARSLCNSDEKPPGGDNPNKISEDTVKCLSSIFSRISSVKNRHTADCLPFLSTLMSEENGQECELQDPYHICSEFGKRDIGPYKQLFSVKAGAINPNRTSNCLFLLHRLKLLLGKLAAIDLQKLTHQEKLAFWINIYNSCMMNAFLENGMPESPEMIVVLMQKATINVGGHLLNPITIEHFILRLPYHSKYNLPRGVKNEDVTTRSKFGLELSEPLVTFALSCGSWSSPAVRVYTASQVENELEAAKREYLQAAIGISGTKFGIPKLLDWYLLDFAKDLESFLDWICLQLPTELGKEAIMYLERGKSQPHSQFVQIMPYEFSFRYLLYT